MRNIKFMAFCLSFISLLSCKSAAPAASPASGMFSISIMYPAGKDKTFDMDYYEKNHMPMMARILGKNLKFYEIDKGISGRTSNDEAPYVALCHFYCYSIADYNKSVAQNIDSIRNDVKKYTNIQPVVQISEVRQLK